MKSSLYTHFLKIVFLFVIISVFAVGGFWFRQMYVVYEENIKWVDVEFKNDKKEVLKNLVESVIKISSHLAAQSQSKEDPIEILKNIASVSYVKDGQINIFTQEGVCLASSGGCGNVGRAFMKNQSEDKKNYIKQGFELAKKGGGFVEYKLKIDGILHSKIGYFKEIKEFNLIISSCQSYNDLDQAAAKQKETLKENLIHGLISLIVISILMSLIVVYIFRYFFAKIKKEYEYINSCLQKAEDEDLMLDKDKLNFLEFSKMAEFINKLIFTRSSYEKSLLMQKEKADEASEAKTKFIAQMSHEIRTPMNSIIGFGELLKRTNLDEKQQQYLNSISVSSELLLRTLNDILDAGKLEAKKAEINLQEFSLAELTNEIYNSFADLAIQKGLEFSIEVSDDKGIFIVNDRSKMYQILANLVGNSIKFTNNGFVKLLIKIDGNNVCFIVKDSGIGMDLGGFDDIFEPFGQEHDINQNYGGSGLGLFIVKNIVELLKGSVSFSSKKNIGTEFVVCLANIEINRKSINHKVPNEQFCDFKILRFKPVVLIVDDQLKNLELLREVLVLIGADVIEATDGKKALAIIENQNIDIIFTDIVMPIMDGIKLSKELKKRNIKIPIIAVSADVSMLRLQNDDLFDEFVLKPININIIGEMIEKFLAKQGC